MPVSRGPATGGTAFRLPASWAVYLLENAAGALYTGITPDVPRRLDAHNRGAGAKYTRGRGPWRLVYCESPYSYAAALSREHFIKRLTPACKRALFGGPRVAP